MRSFRPSPGDPSEATFDDRDAYVPAHLPEPGAFLSGHEVLTGDDHLAVHAVARDLFEERRVYDATFGYNLARLNEDARHPDAGYRYAVQREDADGDSTNESDADADDRRVLRAEFTPTTPFCPQSNALTVGSFRAWNGLADRHEFDLVRVRVAPMHHRSESINDELAALEAEVRETGEVPDPDGAAGGAGDSGAGADDGEAAGGPAPF